MEKRLWLMDEASCYVSIDTVRIPLLYNEIVARCYVCLRGEMGIVRSSEDDED